MRANGWILTVFLAICVSVMAMGCTRVDSEKNLSKTAETLETTELTQTTETNAITPSTAYNNNDKLSDINGPVLSKEQLTEDFDQLVSLIEKYHPKLYADTLALDAVIESSRVQIKDKMTELEFFRVLSPIVTQLNCGHTCLMLSLDTQTQLLEADVMFPLYLHWVDDRAYVTQNPFTKGVPIGSELLSINGKLVSEVRETILANITADGSNTTRKVRFMNNNFNYFYAANVDVSPTYEIVYRITEDSQSLTETVQGVKSDAFYEQTVTDWLDFGPPFFSTFESDYAVITFHSFYPEGEYTLTDYKTFMDEFFAEVKDKKIEKIILDVRGNGGGDPYVASHLFSYLAKIEQPYFVDRGVRYYQTLFSSVPLAENRFTGKLAILMDGISFSTTGHLLALLKSQDIGTFFGEESGGSYACTDSSQDFSLTHSNLRFHSSMQVWEVHVEGVTPGRGIIPDFPVEPTLEQYLSREDVIMKTAIKWLNLQKP